MAYAEHVSEELWNSRYNWLRKTEEAEIDPRGSYLLSAQGTFMTYDLEIAFCAGAWVSVILLGHAAIDSTIRDTDSGDYKSNSKITFGGDADLEWLRKKRNTLVHVSETSIMPESELHNLDKYHDALEADAKRAIQLVFRAIYANPGT